MTKKTKVPESKINEILVVLDSGEANNASEKTLAFFHDMPEEERRQYAKPIQKFCRERQNMRSGFSRSAFDELDIEKLRQMAQGVTNTFQHWQNIAKAVWLALLATATPGEIEKCNRQFAGSPWFQPPHTDDSLFTVLSNRKPEWLDEFLQTQFETASPGEVWKEYRRFYEAGLVARNLSPPAILGLYAYYQWFNAGTHAQPVRLEIDYLRNDKELLEKEIWLLFDLPLPELQIWVPQGTVNRWYDALITLSVEGFLSREQLLDATLDGLSKNYLEWQENWLLGFHKHLAPTADEQLLRIDKYTAILGSQRFPTAHFGLENLQPFIKSDQMDETKIAAMFKVIPPLLLDKSKGRIKKLLSFFELVQKSKPALRLAVTPLLFDAVVHENKDIQESAAKQIVKYADFNYPETGRRIQNVLPSLSPSVQMLFSEFRPSVESPPTIAETKIDYLKTDGHPEAFLNLASVSAVQEALQNGDDFLPPSCFNGMEIPRLSSEKRLMPVASVRELIDLMLWMLEHPFDFTEFERIVDGIARLTEIRDEEFERHVGPILKWFDTKNQYYWPWLDLIESWAKGETTSGVRHSPMDQVDGYWSGTMDRIYQAKFQSGAFQPLCTPTHRGGWIDPILFVERLVNNRDTLRDRDIFDKLLALFRLAPDHRAEALIMLDEAKLDDDGYIEAVRYALGAEYVTITPVLPEWSNAPIWAAASRVRNPFGEDVFVQNHFQQLGNGTTRPARYETMLVRDIYRQAVMLNQPLNIHGYSAPRAFLVENRYIPFQAYFTDFTEEFVPIENKQLYPSILAYQFSPYSCSHNYNLWPANRDLLCLQWIVELAEGMNSKSYDESKAGCLEILLDPDMPFTPEAAMLWLLALSCIAPTVQTLAVDIGIAVIQDGRWNEELLLENVKLLLPFAEKVDYPKDNLSPSLRQQAEKIDMYQQYRLMPSRWPKCFAAIANESPLHAQSIRRVLERIVPQLPDKDAGAFLELLYELCVASGEVVEHEETRRFLAALKGGGKAAKAGKKLLGLVRNESLSQSHRRRAAEQALQSRMERVKRWYKS
ncbi:MAG: DUF6493 family protein [Planctomycetaceae bacterium]|nr:DUF6493 family protein [Planctomycetaceae bacterium]